MTQLGGWRYSELSHFFGDSARLCVPMCSQGNPISIFMSRSHTEEQEVERRLNLKTCVVCSRAYVSLEGRKRLADDRAVRRGNDEAGS